MNNVINIICSILPNKVYIRVPALQKDMTYIVTGISNLDTDTPMVIVKKNEPDTRATFNVPHNLVSCVTWERPVTNSENNDDY